MKVVIIGSGNTATVLGRKIISSGHNILQVFGRNASAVQSLAAELGAEAKTQPEAIDRRADIYILAVADQALPDIHQWINLDKRLVVHTSAAVSKNVLSKISMNYGVLYPLQTLRKEQTEIPPIPFLVDGNTADDLALIQDFAGTLSDKVQVAGDDLRLRVHVAAVFVSNFTNHLYAVADDFCRKEDLDFKLLMPLIRETAGRLDRLTPAQSQTGPAVRRDNITIQKHLAVLDAYPHLRELYETLTLSIQRSEK
ncbi:MAG TPA: DUF2520 domain-containing protein [Chitinophagaceae bacterium]